MKNFLKEAGLVVLILGSGVGVVYSQPLPPPPATQGEVNQGLLKNKYVSPFTLANTTNGVAVVSNFSQTITFNGKVTLNSNVYVLSIFYQTNTLLYPTINVNRTFESYSTNDSLAFTGYSGVDGTNVIPFTRAFTNTAGSAAVKSITLPPGTVVLSAPYFNTNVVYITNKGFLSGLIWPGFGTNATWVAN